ncbi:thiamine-phosphate kinase [Pelagibius sp. Alg239-R121]|uniref:thiamine-phosphate kinase n=1 Tax=Pelagibius sp. Alg239-R121 TaxID=2993448 RepID=UPI0024A6526B|nr:thiamine-phosphate kinase [Pelagibius sp. Alg239-R121]
MSGEFDLIERFFAPLAKDRAGTFELKNDAAILPDVPGCSIVVTADSLASGVHFLPENPPELVAKKCLRVNLSDLAAMGAKPLGYLLALALPKGANEEWVRRFSEGLAEDQSEFGLSLYGGDTVATDGPLLITIIAFGSTPQGGALGRNTAQTGDLIYTSGTLGDSALGLRAFRGELPELDDVAAARLRDRYLLPRPRCRLGERLLAGGLAHAAMDVSDGLVADLGHICKASRLGAEISVSNLPLSAAAAAVLETNPGLGSAILGGGDDYELLFTLAPEHKGEIAKLALDLDLPLTCIGKMVQGDKVEVFAPDGTRIEVDEPGWNHLS